MNKENAQEIRAETLLTSYQVGSLLQVNPSSVNKWVKDGRIPAFRTPGGHRRIRAIDLVAFLHKHEMPIPSGLAHAAQRRLLVVDANDGEVETIRGHLSGHHDSVQVQSVANAIDALVQVGSFRPHAVLLDAAARDLDIVEICRRLKANPETREITIILAGGDNHSDLRQKAEQAGADRCIAKPVAREVLLQALGIVRAAG